MHVFQGHEHRYELELTLRKVQLIKAHLGIDFLRPQEKGLNDQPPVFHIFTDIDILFDVALIAIGNEALKAIFPPPYNLPPKPGEDQGPPCSLRDLFVFDVPEIGELRTLILQELRDFFHRSQLAHLEAVVEMQEKVFLENVVKVTETARQVNTKVFSDQVDAGLNSALQSMNGSTPAVESSSSPTPAT